MADLNFRHSPSSPFSQEVRIVELLHEYSQIHLGESNLIFHTAVSSEAWAKLRDWASVAGRGRLLLSGSDAHASLKTAVFVRILLA